jgi:hypothetical protein
VDTDVTDYVYDTDSGLTTQETITRTDMTNGVTAPPSVRHEIFYTIIFQNTDADGKKTYKKMSTTGPGNYQLYTIKDGVTLSYTAYRPDGTLISTYTYTFPDNPVIRARLPGFTLTSVAHAPTPSYNSHETCELVESTDTSLIVRMKTFNTSTNSVDIQDDFTYTKRTLP